MARITQEEQPRGTTGGGSYSETPEQKRGWAKLADWIEESLDNGTLIQGDTFTVKGFVKSMDLDNGKFFRKTFKDRNTGEEKVTTTTKVTAVIDDRRFTPEGVLLPLPVKDLGTSFFDGRMRDGTRGIARGSMYHLHLAVTYQEPSPELVANKGAWDTDDYIGKPVLLVVDFAGWEPEGSQYFNSRSGLRVFLNKFERDLEARKSAPAARGGGRSGRRPMVTDPEPEEVAEQQDPPFAPTGDEFDDDPTPPTPTRGRSRAASAGAGAGGSATAGSTATGSGGDPASQRATERQVKFIYAIAREAGLDEQELTDWSEELYGTAVISNLNRRDASALIESLQRRRNEVA